MYRFQLLILAFVIFSCKPETPVATGQNTTEPKPASGKIQVLNFGTFHFGYTPDANSTAFDENSARAQEEARQLSLLISRFQPTVICVEAEPANMEKLNEKYQQFLQNPEHLMTENGEIGMVAFEVGRLCKVPQLYGIDHQLGYNYSVGDFIEDSPELENAIDRETYLQLTNDPFREYPALAARYASYEELDLKGKLALINEPDFLEFSIITNADKLMYVGLEDGFEGADNAALFYQRNMRIFSNLNRIKLKPTDRVFILMGAAHTAFLREFMSRSPKYEMVNTLDYLK